MFGTEAFSLKNAYITCIGEQLINALNDQGRLGSIYNGLTKYILAKHGGSLNLPRISPHDCTRSPITRMLYLLKKTSATHLKSTLEKFPLHPTQLETQWMSQAHHAPTLTPTTSLKYLHKLLTHHITELKHITNLNGTHLMTNDEFKYYYVTPTKPMKTALDYARKIFCESPCHNQCPNICPTHTPPNTLKTAYIIQNHHINPNINRHNIHLTPPSLPEFPKPPSHIQHNHTKFPIQSIINDHPHTYKDKHKITKHYTSFLCQWILLNEIKYYKWLPQRELFPWNNQNTINHNILLLTQYYTKK